MVRKQQGKKGRRKGDDDSDEEKSVVNVSAGPPKEGKEMIMDDSGLRIDQWVAKRLDITRSRVVRAAKDGGLLVDGRPVKASAKPKLGAIVRFSDAVCT